MKKNVLSLSVAAGALMLAGCGGDDASSVATTPVAVDTGSATEVSKAVSCSTGDSPETGLQGQVPAALRASGFKGFNCNLKQVAQFQGEGGDWSSATFTDGAGHRCFYHATSVANAARTTPGTPVIDLSNPSQLLRTTSLTTQAMKDPWESLRVNARRQILVADDGATSSNGSAAVDIYDLSGDCRSPQLLATVNVGTGADGGVAVPVGVKGHEGNFAPDGLTYYIGDIVAARYHAVDLTNTTKPKIVASFDVKALNGLGTHGLSVSTDGNRMYGVLLGIPATGTIGDGKGNPINGFAVFDTSEVQQRKPNAQIKVVSQTLFLDGSVAQHTIPIKVAGKSYLVMVDEAGSAGLADVNGTYIKTACAAGLTPFPIARLYDLTDETKPVLVSKFQLETHDCKNQAQTLADTAGLSIFTYGSHYCSVDNRDNATALACGYFNSGIRVFDIRNVTRPKEVAYFNPPTATSVPGSTHAVFGQWKAGGPDWCASRMDFDFAKKQLTTMCQDNGALVLQFQPGTWPFAESSASLEQS